MQKKPITKKFIVDSIVEKQGVKATLTYYVTRAHLSSQRAKTAISTGNTESLAAESQVMIENIDMLRLILADETKPVV